MLDEHCPSTFIGASERKGPKSRVACVVSARAGVVGQRKQT
jgi:hypothetical protein